MSPGKFTAELDSNKGTIGVIDSTLSPRLDGWLCHNRHEQF
ncbi:hypothetical protein [Pseudomonas putida]